MLKFPHLASGDRITRTWFNRLIDYCNSLSLSGDGRTTRVSHGSAGTVVSAIPQSVEAAGGGGGVSWWNAVVKTGALTVTVQHPGQNAATLPVITFPSGTASYFVAYFRTTDRENTAGIDPKPEASPHELYAYFAADGSGNPDALYFDLIHGVEVQILAFVSVVGSEIARIVQYSSAPQILRTRQVNTYFSSFVNLDIFPVYDNWNSTPRLVTVEDFYCTKFRIRGGVSFFSPRYDGIFNNMICNAAFSYDADTDNQTIFFHSNGYLSAGSGHQSDAVYDASNMDFCIPIASYRGATTNDGKIKQLWLYTPIPFMFDPDDIFTQ